MVVRKVLVPLFRWAASYHTKIMGTDDKMGADFPLQGLVGILGILVIATLLSENRARIPWRLVATTLALQLALIVVFFEIPLMRDILLSLSSLVRLLQAATLEGTSFVFGYVGGGAPPFEMTHPENSVVLALQILPIILVTSALSAFLWQIGFLQIIIKAMTFALQKAVKIGGAAGLGAASNVFLGMIESPIIIRPHLHRLSRGELLIVMTTGLATVAGTVLALYASVLETVIPGALGHILTASIVSVPGSVMLCKIMIPDDSQTQTTSNEGDALYNGIIDSISKGTQDGIQVLLSVTAMLVAIIALVYLVNAALGFLGGFMGVELSMQIMLGWIFAPATWALGIPWSEATITGSLLGTKTVLNELLAYLEMVKYDAAELSDRSRIIMIYVLCGFANFGSLGMLLSALSAMIPARRVEIVSLGTKALIGGTMATSLTGALVGLLLF